MKRPEKALILAAGYGARMMPLSADVPKPLMPLWGVPALEHAMALLESWGVRDILLNLHHQPGDILAYVGDRPRQAARVSLSFEPDILGTGGALRRAAWFPGPDPFWILNADVAADLRPEPFLRALRPAGTVAALWLHPRLGPRTVEAASGRVTCFRSLAPGTSGTFTFCGLQLVRPDLLDHLPQDRETFSIVELYERAMSAGRRVAAVIVPGSFWADLGTPRDYLDAHARVLAAARSGAPGARLFARPNRACLQVGAVWNSGTQEPDMRVPRVFPSADRAARVGRGARLENSVLWAGARGRPGGVVTDSIVGRNAAVRRARGAVVVRADGLPGDPVLDKALARLGWRRGQTTAVCLGARGSDRSFTRLERGARSVMFVQYGLARPENARHAPHAAFLRGRGIPVPCVLADFPSERASLMEDLGDVTLEDTVPLVTSARSEALYRRVLDALLLFHAIPLRELRRRRAGLEPPFTAALYRWERELFAEHLLIGRYRLQPDAVAGIMGEMQGIARLLSKARPVLVHRDMQSSNVLLRRGQPWFIDFQGMRLGPAAYDLAALLCDPYVTLAEDVQRRLLLYYARRSPRGDEAVRLFWPAAVQRLAQALGAYGRLSAIHATRRFARYVRPGLLMLARAVARVGGLPATARFLRRALRAEPSPGHELSSPASSAPLRDPSPRCRQGARRALRARPGG
jgi:NDP-sugar pyrophosphorylase family protein/aminoglycoside/choline kinase family phosphotransferase